LTRASLLGMELPFDDVEYTERINNAKRSMSAQGIDALLLFHQESMFYLFGYDQLGYWVYQVAILSLSEEKITVVCREADRDLVEGLPLVREVRVWLDDSADDPIDITTRTLRDLALMGPGRRVGIELRSHALLPFYFRRLADALASSVELLDASDLVTELRLRKSAAEVAYVRKAAFALDASFEASFAAIRPGVRENEVLGCAWKAMMDAGGEVPAIVPPLASGPRTLFGTHGAATNRVLQSGDLFQLEIGAAYQRYHAVGVHSKWLGAPPPDVQRAFDDLRQTLELGIESIGPGVPVADVAGRVNSALKTSGMYTPGQHIGYGTGIGYPPTWLDNLRVKETDQHVLEANMLLFLFLYYNCDDGVSLLFIGEPVLVTPEGVDRLSSVPFSLEVN